MTRKSAGRDHRLRLAGGVVLVLAAVGILVFAARALLRVRRPVVPVKSAAPAVSSPAVPHAVRPRAAPKDSGAGQAGSLFAPLPAVLRQGLQARGDGRCTRGGKIARALVSRPMPHLMFDHVAVREGKILIAASTYRGEPGNHKFKDFILLTGESGRVDWGYRVVGRLDAIALGVSGPVVAVHRTEGLIIGLDWQGHERWRVDLTDSTAEGPFPVVVATDERGDVAVGVSFTGTLRLGPKILTGGDEETHHGAVAILDPGGELRRVRRFAGASVSVDDLAYDRHSVLWAIVNQISHRRKRLYEIRQADKGAGRRFVTEQYVDARLSADGGGSAVTWYTIGDVSPICWGVVERLGRDGHRQWQRVWEGLDMFVDVAMFPSGEVALLGDGDKLTLSDTKVEAAAREKRLAEDRGYDESQSFVALFDLDGRMRWTVDLDGARALVRAGDSVYVVGTYLGAWGGQPSPLFPYVDPGKVHFPPSSPDVGYVARICR